MMKKGGIMAKSQGNSLKKSKDKNLSDYKFKTDNYTKAFTFSGRDLTTGRLKAKKNPPSKPLK